MTDKEKLEAIKTELHRLKEVRGVYEYVFEDIFAFINSLPEETVIEDLEFVIDNYLDNGMALQLDWKQCDITFNASQLIKFANHIAQWQKEQMINSAKQSKIVITSGGILLSDLKIEDFDYADKVRIIIIKDE